MENAIDLCVHLFYFRCNRLHCTLWNEYAERMQLFIETHDSAQPAIIVLQLCKLKKFFGLDPI